MDEGYGAVADAFRENFAARGEIGAACVVYHDGRKVVDLWGGYRDGRTRLPWEAETMVPVFSTSKGVAAVALAVLHARGLLDHDERVAAYWPEFAAAGKGGVTIRQLLAHQAGLAVIDRSLGLGDLTGSGTLATALAEQRPAWEPGQVRSIAKLYGEVATGGTALGLTATTMEALRGAAPPPTNGLFDEVLRVETRFSLGYVKPFPAFRFGSGANRAFGTMGLGGSFAFADPDTGTGFAYAMNRTGFRLWDDPREVALREALFARVLGERPQRPDPASGRSGC
ncbi:serine hydrolase domain-containing protein [Streptomyces sp. NPDC001780]